MKPMAHSQNKASVMDYVAIARPDHWLKNIFMLPGAALAFFIDRETGLGNLPGLGIGIASTCLIASANYTINEYLDGKWTAITRPSPAAQRHKAALNCRLY